MTAPVCSNSLSSTAHQDNGLLKRETVRRSGYLVKAVSVLAAAQALNTVRATPIQAIRSEERLLGPTNVAQNTSAISHNQNYKRAAFYRAPLPTNQNLVGLKSPPGSGFSLTSAISALSNPGSTPSTVAADDTCTYAFIDTVGGFSGQKRVYRNVGSPLYDFDVMQGNVPDCGFGAGILALIGNRDEAALGRSLVLSNSNVLQPTYKARFLMPDATADVYISDNLPNSKNNCGRPLLSYQAPEKNYFVPLLEMAWAKYIDAYPQFRVTKEAGATGYLGLTGSAPRDIMRGVTGRRRSRISRVKTNFDQNFANAILRCLNGKQGCAVRTPDVKSLSSILGPANAAGVYTTDAGIVKIYDPDKHVYTLTDKDKGKVDVTIAGDHWYAIRGDRSGGVKGDIGFNNPNSITVTLTNPWGCNPETYSSNSCATENADIVLSLRATWTMFNAIDTLLD